MASNQPEPQHLLVVDDDARLRDLLKAFLSGAGYRVTVAADAARARKLMAALAFDLLVLDLMMPGEDGLSLTQWVRTRGGAASQAPILILTARGEPDDRIAGLSVGADDYLAKPFEPRELLLRISAILRRSGAAPRPPERLSLGALDFDAARGELSANGTRVRLTEAETHLLRILAQSPHGVVGRSALAGGVGEGRAVDIQVTRLRRKIEPDPANPRYLRTVRGRGYMLTPD
jgi:two-component system phosphate regulon response regulator OmpR